jgi:hypothetical protein
MTESKSQLGSGDYEFARPEPWAGLSSTAQHIELAQGQPRDGVPLRAEINVVGYLARKP